MREREVRYITNEARTEYFVVRPEWRGFDVRRAGRADRRRDRVHRARRATRCRPVIRRCSRRRPVPSGSRRWLYHTSGSTSDPKGAWHADASVIAGMYAFVTRVQPTPDDVYPICFPVAHIGGANMLAAALHVGYLLPLIEAFDAERSPQFMAEQGATLLGTALPMFQAYLAAQRKHGDQPLFPRLRTCVGGGAPKTPGIDEVIRARARWARRREQLGADRVPDRHQRQRRRHPRADRDHRGSAVTRGRAPRRRPRRDGVRPRRGRRAPAPRPASVPRLRRSRRSTPTRSTSRGTCAPATSGSSRRRVT